MKRICNNDVTNRIAAISERFFSGNTSAMAREIGVKQSTLRDIISGKVKPSYDPLFRIVENSTMCISSEWLLRGDGEMTLLSDGSRTEQPQPNETEKDNLIEELKAELNQLKGENRILREMLNLKAREEERVKTA